MTIYFHVVEGSQAGAKLELEYNRQYIISADYLHDIYLNLEKPQEIAFEINDSGIFFSNYTEQVFIGQLRNPLVIGSTYALPCEIYVQDSVCLFSNEANPQPAPEQSEKLDPLLDETVDLDTHDDDFIGLIQDKQNVNGKIIAKFTNKAKDTSIWLYRQLVILCKDLHQKIGYFIYLIALLIVLSIVGAIVFIYQYEQEQNINNKIVLLSNAKIMIQKKLLSMSDKFANVHVRQLGDTFVLSGVLENKELLGQLKDQISQSNYSKVVYKVRVYNEIASTILQILKQNAIQNPGVNYQSRDGMGVVLSGITDAIDNVDNAEIEINNKIGDIGQIDTSQIYIIKDIEKIFSTIPPDILSQLSVQKNYESGLIIMNGFLPKAKIDILNEDITAFNKAYSGVVTIQANLQDILKVLPFSVKEIYLGNPSWIISNDGTRLYEGGTYKGITIVKINPGVIIFKSKFEFSISIDELTGINSNANSNQINIDNGNCSRSCIIKQERNHESMTINKEKEELKNLKAILNSTKDKNLQKDLQNTINNLTQDLIGLEHEYNLYDDNGVIK